MDSVKEALIESLDNTLSSEDNLRKEAEGRLKLLEVTDHFGVHLLDIVRDTSYPRGRRQLASVLLRQYVDTHWTASAEKFVPPEPNDQVKETIRQITPMLLADPESKIRNSVACVISSIGHWDWPENWPNLFDVILPLLKDQKMVKGAMRVMTELAQELTDQHILQVAPVIYAEMFRILNNEGGIYTPAVRVRAIEVFRSCTTLIITTSEVDKAIISTTLDPVLEQYMQLFVRVLQENNSPDLALKKAVVKITAVLVRLCPKRAAPYLNLVLAPIWAILTSSIDAVRRYFNGEDEDTAEDSDGDECTVGSVIFSILELIQILLENPSLNGVIKSGLDQLIYYVVFYMQLPQERVEAWVSNPVSFATDEDEDNATYTLRVCAQDLLQAASEEFPDECLAALGSAVQRHLANNPTNDWRLHEACLAAVSSLGTRIVKPITSPNASGGGESRSTFDIHGFIQNVVIPGLSSGDVLLSGRCLVLGSNFCTVLSPELTRRFVQVACEHVAAPNQTVIARILAAKAITIFVEQAKDNLTVKMALLEYLPGIMDAFISFAAGQVVEILSGFLDIMVGILGLDENFAASISQNVISLVIACFVKFNGDPVICPTIEDIVATLCKNKQCVESLQVRFIPTLASVLSSRSADTGGPQGVSLDILTAIVRSSPVPLSPVVMNAFGPIIECLKWSEDQTVLQNGGECLRAYTYASPSQLFEWRDNAGISGLEHVVSFAARLLDPSASEFSATFVGKLVNTLIVKTADRLGDQLQLLLRAVLSKLQSADTLSVIQNLCLVYAQLFNTQMEPALNFLDTVPGPTGQSALHFVMTEWVTRQQCFFGQFDRKVSAIALSKLLQHGIATNDPRLAAIQVKGDPIIDPNQPMMTRSRRGRDQWTQIPLLVKIFKLLIHELSYSTVNEECEESDDENSNSEDDNDKENDFTAYHDDDLDIENNMLNLDDPDVVNDPLFPVDLEAYLKQFLQSFSTCAQYRDFFPHVSDSEIKVLKTCQIPVPAK